MPSLYRSTSGHAAVMAHYDDTLKHSPTPCETREVETRHGRTHLIITGPPQAPPLLVFHGWNGNAVSNLTDFPFLFPHYRTYIPDIIGHPGKSAPNRPNPAGAAYADWVADVLDALHLPQVLMVGISGGGWLTLKFAAYYPQRVMRAVALSADGFAKPNLWGLMFSMLPYMLSSHAVIAQRLTQFFTAPSTAQDTPAVQAFAQLMTVVLKHFRTQNNPGLLPPAELQKITRPVLLLMGEYERIFNPHHTLARARQLIPSLVAAELVKDAGHLMTRERPQWLAERILRFLAKGI